MHLRWQVVARPMDPIYGDYLDFLVYAVDIAAAFLVALWLFDVRRSGRKISTGPIFIWAPLAGFAVLGLLGSITSVTRPSRLIRRSVWRSWGCSIFSWSTR